VIVTTAEPVRRRGRQAEAARNDYRLLDAAREVFSTHGLDAPVAAIAERAGVGIGSLYRRYATKEQLLQHLCLDAMRQYAEAAQDALAEPDPWTGLAHYIRTCVANLGSGSLASIAGTITITPELQRAFTQANRLAHTLVRRAHAAGALRADATTQDVFALIEQLSRRGPAAPTDEDDNARQRLIAITLDGLRAHHTQPLPGKPPSRQRNQVRWTKR
jgi:AcrR family transcriptional regulator